MKKLMMICLSVSLNLSQTACTQAPSSLIQPGQPQAGSNPTLSSQTGTIKGRLVLPYRVQTGSRVAQAGFAVMAYVIGQPAEAQEATSESESPEPSTDSTGPLTESEVQNLTATVDGQPVELTVTEVTPSPTSPETVVEYQIDQAPVGTGMEVVEIQAPSGGCVGGAVVDAQPGTTTVQDITPTSTAVLETAAEMHGSEQLADISASELMSLLLEPKVIKLLSTLSTLLRKQGAYQPKERKYKAKGHGKHSASPSPTTSPTTSPTASPSPSPSACACPSASPQSTSQNSPHSSAASRFSKPRQDDHDHDDDRDDKRSGKGSKGRNK